LSEERVFLSEHNIYVTNARIVIDGTTYSTANITSVRKTITPASTGCATILMILGALAALSGLPNIFGDMPERGLPVLFVGLVAVVAGVAIIRSQKATYHVRLASSSGERQALTSRDEAMIDRATIAMADAIVFRG
jgi:hypothetical protein